MTLTSVVLTNLTLTDCRSLVAWILQTWHVVRVCVGHGRSLPSGVPSGVRSAHSDLQNDLESCFVSKDLLLAE